MSWDRLGRIAKQALRENMNLNKLDRMLAEALMGNMEEIKTASFWEALVMFIALPGIGAWALARLFTRLVRLLTRLLTKNLEAVKTSRLVWRWPEKLEGIAIARKVRRASASPGPIPGRTSRTTTRSPKRSSRPSSTGRRSRSASAQSRTPGRTVISSSPGTTLSTIMRALAY